MIVHVQHVHVHHAMISSLPVPCPYTGHTLLTTCLPAIDLLSIHDLYAGHAYITNTPHKHTYVHNAYTEVGYEFTN